MRAHNFVERFRSFIRYHDLVPVSGKVLLGVSGGPDSMALAHLLWKEGVHLVLGHVNYGFRGVQSDAEETLLREWAQERGITVRVERLKAGHPLHKSKSGRQEKARELRYHMLGRWADELGCMAVAVAHQQDDWVETFFHQLFRGTALSGWAGMQARQDLEKWLSVPLIRPLLWAPRIEIMEYLKVHRIPWKEDRSNQEVHYTRNKIRLELLPLIRKLNPNIAATLWENGERMLRIKQFLDGAVQEKLTELVQRDQGQEIFHAPGMDHMEQGVLLEYWLLPKGFSPAQLGQICRRNPQTGSVWSSPQGSLHFDRDYWVYKASINEESVQGSTGHNNRGLAQAMSQAQELEIRDPGTNSQEYSWQGHRIKVYCGIPPKNFPAPAVKEFKTGMQPEQWVKTTQAIALQAIEWPLVLRFPKEGDRIRPLGMAGHKKLGDLFTDLKLDYTRSRIPVLECAGKVIWVAGVCVDERVAVQAGNKSALVISFNP